VSFQTHKKPIFGTKKIYIFEEISEVSEPGINVIATFKAQKGSKNIVKIINP